MARTTLYKGQRSPLLSTTIKDADGNALDLTGHTVKLALRLVYDTTNVFKGTATVANQTTNRGQVSYTLAAGDLATAPTGVLTGQWIIDEGGAGYQPAYAGEFELLESF